MITITIVVRFLIHKQLQTEKRETGKEWGLFELTDDAKISREDKVQEDIREGREGPNAALLLGRDEGRRAHTVGLEGRKGAVEVAAAVELYPHVVMLTPACVFYLQMKTIAI